MLSLDVLQKRVARFEALMEKAEAAKKPGDARRWRKHMKRMQRQALPLKAAAKAAKAKEAEAKAAEAKQAESAVEAKS